MDSEEIKSALKRAEKGLTARQMLSQCESFGDLNEIVREVQALKAAGAIMADGMRENQVVYKLAGAAKAQAPKPMPPAPPAPTAPPRRTGSGLREGLFDMMDRLRDGKVDVERRRPWRSLHLPCLR